MLAGGLEIKTFGCSTLFAFFHIFSAFHPAYNVLNAEKNRKNVVESFSYLLFGLLLTNYIK